MKLGALKNELNQLSKNKMLIASLIVLLFVPIMYGGFFLGSVWDPYGNTKNLPVAVVNQDQGAVLDDQKLNVGDQLVDNLRQNDSMGWKFVDKSTADQGLRSGDFYMMIEIPADFSAKAASLNSSHPVKGVINYTTTPDRNYVASLLTNSAAKEIKQNVSDNLTKAYLETMFKGVVNISDGMENAAGGAQKLAMGGETLNLGLSNYTSGVSQLNGGIASLNSGLTQIKAGASTLENGVAEMQASLPTTEQIDQLNSGVLEIQQGMNQLSAAVQNPSAAMISAQNNLTNQQNLLQNTLADYRAKASDSANAASLQNLKQLAAGDTSVEISALDAQNLISIMESSGAVLNSVSDFSQSFADFQIVLNENQSLLKTNISSLASGMNTVVPVASSAILGYNNIHVGLGQLSVGATNLSRALQVVQTGSQNLMNGSLQLNNNSNALKGGMSELSAGNRELAVKLTQASQQVKLQSIDSGKKVDHASSPIETHQESKGNVKIYGYALAPYVLSIGLFVGALSFNVIYPVATIDRKNKAGSNWLAKATIFGGVAVGQALVLDLIMVLGLGLRPDNIMMFIGGSIVSSLAFMSIISCLSIMLGNVGRFLAMLLLVVQLGSSEGVFPIGLSPQFFQNINPFVPMTYSIKSFKAAISTNLDQSMFWWSMLVLAVIVIVVNFILWVYFKFREDK